MKTISNIRYGKYEENVLDLYLPNSDNFLIFIYFHGGGIEGGDKISVQECAKLLAKNNIAVVSANYRMYPEAVYPEFLKDAAAVVGWVNDNISQYGSCNKIYIGGSSAGGYISMMLCFDKKYLSPYKLDMNIIGGFIHDAGQPTVHFNVLRERGIDSRRVIIDEAAPIFHIGNMPEYPPMIFIVSDSDMQNRYEQTMLMLSTLKHFEYDENKIKLKVMHGTHCHYIKQLDENGESIFGKIILDFINEFN